MLECEGAFSVESVDCGKHLVPGKLGESLVEVLECAGADPSEFLVDGRFERRYLSHTVLQKNAVRECLR